MYFRICPCCGAYLDPGEICDCAEKAAPGGNDTEDGKGNESTIILAKFRHEVKEVIDYE